MSAGFYSFAKVVVRFAFRTVWGLRVLGAEHVPTSGPLIIAANHRTYFDPPALAVAAPRPVAYMAKRQLFSIPLFGRLITTLGAFPVDRARGDVAAFKAALAVVGRGDALGIFPEGTRNLRGDVAPQLGVALLAERTGATVVPAYVAVFPWSPRATRMCVAFGEPLRFERDGKASRDEMAKWTKQLMERIRALGESV